MKRDLLTPEVTDALDIMLRKLATQKVMNGHLKMDVEDVVSELWINALKIIDATNKVDFNYIAKASFHKMVDLTRANIRREATAMDSFERILPESLRNQQPCSAGSERSDAYTFSTAKPESATERVELLDILNLFPKDSKEYKLVEAWMEILGILDPKDASKIPEKAFDNYIAVDVLGYAASKSNGYARLRNKVREVLIINGYRAF